MSVASSSLELYDTNLRQDQELLVREPILLPVPIGQETVTMLKSTRIVKSD